MNTNYFCDTCSKNTPVIVQSLTKQFNMKGTSIEAVIEVNVCSTCGSVINCFENRQKTLFAARQKYEKMLAYNPDFLKEVRSQ